MLARLFLISLAVYTTQSQHIDRARRNPLSSMPSSGIRMQPVSAGASSSDGSTTGITNLDNNFYLVNVTLGGAEFTLALDTGSSDLVVFPDKPIAIASVAKDSPTNETYGKGMFSGPIAIAKFEFGGFTVESQAYLNATEVDDAARTIYLSQGLDGILGIELTTFGSLIRDELVELYGSQNGMRMGRQVLENIFEQDPSLGNFTVVALGRSDDGEGTGESYLSIGEYPDKLEGYFLNVNSIETITPNDFSVLVDKMTVNGKQVFLNSSLRDIPPGKVVANLDTGTSGGLVPKDILDAMYGGIPGAWYSDAQTAWIVPCLNDAPNITLSIGGHDIHFHPLDLTNVMDLRPHGYNYTACVSSFNVLFFDEGLLDFLLGDSFFRNAYTSFYYGDFDANMTRAVKSPSVKLVPTSNSVDADYSDFLTRRRQNLASLPPEGTRAQIEDYFSGTQIPSSGGDASSAKNVAPGDSSDGSYTALLGKLNTFVPVVFGLLGAIFVVLLSLLGVVVALCIKRGGTVGAARGPNPLYSSVPVRFKEPEREYKDEESAAYDQ